MASSRSSCSPASLYRLEHGRPLTEYLRTLESGVIQSDTEVPVHTVAGRLVLGTLQSERPQWDGHVQSLTGHDGELHGELPFAVLLVPLQPWTYALTWGAGHLLLEDEFIEQGFGLLFGIRRLDAGKLGLVASSALDVSARSTQISYPGGSDLAGFRLEPYGEIVTRMSGSADLTGLTYHKDTGRRYRIRAANSLSLPLPHDPAALIADLRAIGEVVDESDEHSVLRFAVQVRPLASHYSAIPELRRRLAVALGGDDRYGPLGLAWPSDAVDDIEAASSFKVRGPKALGTFVLDTNIEIGDLTARFAQVPVAERIEALGKARIVACNDEFGQEGFSSLITAKKWFAFETIIDHTRYCYQQGKWFRIGENYVKQITDQVGFLLQRRANLTFPTWKRSGRKDDEHLFCQEVATVQPGYLCLDKDLARTPFHPKFELCDILGPVNELIHVKWLDRAHAASHLIIQAQASADAFRGEPETMTQLTAKIRGRDPARVLADVPDTVVLAAGGRVWDTDKLFTLSQIALLRLDRALRAQRMTLQFADIPFVPKTGMHGKAEVAA